MKLTTREKSALFMEGVVTVILLLMINLALLVMISQAIESNPGLRDGIFIIKRSVVFGPNHFQLWSWENVFISFLGLADILVVWWRLIRRYRQMQLHHIIDELHYIASGHFDHRVPFRVTGDVQRVVDSVNALVDSVIHSMDEERAIEKSKDELITNVSHDIRTPLTSIIGYLGLIEDKQYHSQADLLKYTHTAFLKSKQMKSLVEDLFEYTKVRQTDTPLSLTNIDLAAMLEQLAASFELEAQKKGMTIGASSTPSVLMMEADPEKLVRIFNNLVANALKYGDGGKQINLIAKQINDNELEVRVTNDGPKIPKESLSMIFERFYRVEESRSKETGGTGLGLAIAQSIVALHGGYIYVESDDDLTSFVIHLPVKHDQPLAIPQRLKTTN
ncbi:sensor histidine kinase [Levilactobacillus brevis]|uniref:histidine kinase n=1 Tax=Levilactobacillus brevis (strain ATCC 367 / BCRC 12310 / CIP 105137 / JCM 1170 / LMG 11437 / NCIMB 947 / NCTC 947) TaxID=387344 RepID=Q03NW0_LEVBA|nr:HAMP domain-containing sensor histidine kinase [Levilactobacillus brevis]MBL3537196.1 HAMP domain-containing histidine kinase [Lactobacillus sp. GPR40-2]MBL3630354.1 HAMP domain-containing histidine kinase [Lactobacillus sp. GPB7-4]ABJ65112.1 Signal transduction histidine kinase [Levilactobacillus brevis ATCC 367]ARQ92696.1 two-component sensor histidine kinase [Levilactobacillus brevis]ARW23030.1 Histidine kinase [Levilactobacillus brevis]